jgi:hypothetical protein
LAGWFILVAILLAACSSTGAAPPATAAKPLSPVGTALAWFHAIDTDNASAARSFFVPGDRQQMAWMNEPGSNLPKFSGIRCRPERNPAGGTAVRCTFKESSAPLEGNPDTFWSVDLQRASGGRWLIDNYGQP